MKRAFSWFGASAILVVGLGFEGAAGAEPPPAEGRLGPASLDVDTCGAPSDFADPECRTETAWRLEKTTEQGTLVAPDAEAFLFDITVVEGPTGTSLTGYGQLVVTNSGEQSTFLSSIAVNLAQHTAPGTDAGPGRGGTRWHLLATAVETESRACVATPCTFSPCLPSPPDTYAETCYGTLYESPGALLALFDRDWNEIALSHRPPIPPSLDDDEDGFRDEDPSLPEDPSLITGGCSVIDNDGDGFFDEDPVDGIDNDQDGLFDEDDPDDDGDGLVDEDGWAGDAVVLNFTYAFDLDVLDLEDDHLRIDLIATFDAGGKRGGTCSVDVDCDGVDEAYVRSTQLRLQFDLPECDTSCQEVRLTDVGAQVAGQTAAVVEISAAPTPSEPPPAECIDLITTTLDENVQASGNAGTVSQFEVTGTVSCVEANCAATVANTAELTCDDDSLIEGSPASASFKVRGDDAKALCAAIGTVYG
ncbi:MAG: hypothetical protein JRI25_06940, partial [Deltaproteobacteria bacterium]|nr:hypothetical protein [Deltaproteobacteria bacterium]